MVQRTTTVGINRLAIILFSCIVGLATGEIAMDHLESTLTKSEADRRAFLQSCGRFAATVPPAMTVMLSTSLTSDAIAKSTGHGEGGGHGEGRGKGRGKGKGKGRDKGRDRGRG
jgi:hypothetical protein